MTALGDFLERFYGSSQLFQTVYARVLHTTTNSPKDVSSGRRPIGRPRQGVESGRDSSKHLVFWARLPDKVRVESTQENDGKSEHSIEVVNGETQWKRHVNGTVEKGVSRRRSRQACQMPTEFQRHFDRRLLRECFAALTLEASGECVVANRKCLKIRAVQMPGAQLWPHWLSFAATQFEFAADVERAVLLSIDAIVGEQTVESHKVVEVTFDDSLDETLFVYEPTPDETVQPAIPVTEHTSLEAAAVRAPFAVLQPAYLPENDRLNCDAVYHPARPSNMVESLTIFYRGAESFESLWIDQRGEPEKRRQEELEWDEFEVEGHVMAMSDPHPDEGLRVLSAIKIIDKPSIEIIDSLRSA